MWSDMGGDMEVLSREVRGPSADSERMDVLGLLGPGQQQGSRTGEDAAVGEGVAVSDGKWSAHRGAMPDLLFNRFKMQGKNSRLSMEWWLGLGVRRGEECRGGRRDLLQHLTDR